MHYLSLARRPVEHPRRDSPWIAHDRIRCQCSRAAPGGSGLRVGASLRLGLHGASLELEVLLFSRGRAVRPTAEVEQRRGPSAARSGTDQSPWCRCRCRRPPPPHRSGKPPAMAASYRRRGSRTRLGLADPPSGLRQACDPRDPSGPAEGQRQSPRGRAGREAQCPPHPATSRSAASATLHLAAVRASHSCAADRTDKHAHIAVAVTATGRPANRIEAHARLRRALHAHSARSAPGGVVVSPIESQHPRLRRAGVLVVLYRSSGCRMGSRPGVTVRLVSRVRNKC